MRKVVPVLSFLMLALLCFASFKVAQLLKPDAPALYALGYTIGVVIFPLGFALLAPLVKQTMSENKSYDWNLFHWFLISFCFLSVYGKYAEYQKLQESPPTEKSMDKDNPNKPEIKDTLRGN